MTIEAQLPDGTTLEFPDGTDDAVIDSSVKQQMGLNQQQPDQPTQETPQPVLDKPEIAPQEPEDEGAYPYLSLDDKIGIYAESFTDTLKTQGAQFAKDMTRPESKELMWLMSGATAGGKVGMPLGPQGMAVGSVLGVMMGKTMNDYLAGKELNAENVKAILKEGIYESLGLKVADIFNGQLIDRGLKKLYGVGEKSVEFLADAARRQGIDIGITDVGNQVARGAKTVLGVFPFVASPFREATIRQQDQAGRILMEKLDAIAPHSIVSELGVDMTKAARNSYKEFRAITGALYKGADKVANNLSVQEVVPTYSFKNTINQLKQGKAELVTAGGKPIKGPARTDLDDYIDGIGELPDRISVQQLRTIQNDISNFFDQAGVKGYDTVKLARLKKASDTAMLNLDVTKLPKEEADEVIRAYKLANSTFFEGMKHFETSTSKRFARVDRNIFSPGSPKPGSLNEDEVVKAVFNSGSPQAIRDLRNLVGSNNLSMAARKHLQKTFQSSMKLDEKSGNTVFSATDLKSRLGLTGADNDAVSALDEMLKGTGQTAKDLKEFLDVAEQIGPVVVPAQMVKRRFILGGINSAIRTFTLGTLGAAGSVTVPHSLFITAPAIYLLRRQGKFLTDPNALKNLTKIMDDTTPDLLRRQLTVRMLRLALAGEGQNTPAEDMTYTTPTQYPFSQ